MPSLRSAAIILSSARFNARFAEPPGASALHPIQGPAFQAWDDLYDFPNEVAITKRTAQTALDAVRELAAKGGGGYHRVDLGDVLIAASAQEAGVGVLHYNPKDFDKLAGVLYFRNQQLAPMGTFER